MRIKIKSALKKYRVRISYLSMERIFYAISPVDAAKQYLLKEMKEEFGCSNIKYLFSKIRRKSKNSWYITLTGNDYFLCGSTPFQEYFYVYKK